MKTGFDANDIKQLKEQEQGGGCLWEWLGGLLAVGFILLVVGMGIVMAGRPVAVPTTITAIGGPTQLVLANTPTLKPSSTPAVVVQPESVPGETPTLTAVPTQTPLPTYTPAATQTPQATYTAVATQTPLPTYTPAATWTAVPTVVAFYTPPAPTLSFVDFLVPLMMGLIATGLFILGYLLRPKKKPVRRLPPPSAQPIIIQQPAPTPQSVATAVPDRTPRSTRVQPRVQPEPKRVQATSKHGTLVWWWPLDDSPADKKDVDKVILEAWRWNEHNVTATCYMLFGRKSKPIWDRVTAVIDEAGEGET